MGRRGPLADSYAGAAAMVAFALIPYLALSSAIQPLQTEIARSVGLSAQGMQLTDGMANAGYAFGTLLAVQLAQRTRPRRMLLTYGLLLVAGSVLTAAASTPAMFITGHVIQGLCTSLLLIAAAPPLVVGWPAKRMPITVAVMNLGIFGAVALGPTVGGLQASAHGWRPLFWIAAGTSALALALVLATWQEQPAPDPPGRWDPAALMLAAVGCAAAFFGASELTTHAMLSVIVFLPLLGGVGAIVLLVAHQALASDPLVPVRAMFSTKPLAGIIAAMSAGAASIPAVTLIQQAASPRIPPGHLGALFWPFFGGAILTALIFGLLLRTRWLLVEVVAGLILLTGGVAVVSGVQGGPQSLITVGTGMLGVGVGAAVAPALFVVGYSLRSSQIQRVLALMELLRAVAAFMTGPVLLHLAQTTDGGVHGHGIRTALWCCFAIAGTGMLLVIYLLVLGRVKLQRPDIERWQQEDVPAWRSPRLADGIRPPARSPKKDV